MTTTPHRFLNTVLAAIMAAAMCTAYLLDGPSELDALQATADSVQDAIDSIAVDASYTGSAGQKGIELAHQSSRDGVVR